MEIAFSGLATPTKYPVKFIAISLRAGACNGLDLSRLVIFPLCMYRLPLSNYVRISREFMSEVSNSTLRLRGTYPN